MLSTLARDPLKDYSSRPMFHVLEGPELAPLVQGTILEVARRLPQMLRQFLRSRLLESAGDLYDLEPALHALVAQEVADKVTAAAVQALQEDPPESLARRESAVTSSIEHLACQRQQESVEVTFLGGSTARISTPYRLRRPPRGPGRPRRPGRRGPSGNGLYPRLEVLGIHGGITPALAGEVSRLVATTTYEATSAVLKRRGIPFGRDRVQGIAQRVGNRALRFRDWAAGQLADPESWGTGVVTGKRIVIATDGGRLRVRETNRRGRRRKSGRHSFKAVWREPKVFTIYEIDRKGRRVRKGVLRYDATMRDADGLHELLVAKLREIGAHEASAWIVVGDGADWIWNRVQQLVDEVGYDRRKVTEVVDQCHAVQYLHAIAENRCNWTAEDRARWIRRMRGYLKNGEIEKILAEQPKLAIGCNAKAQRQRFQYLAERIEKMRYLAFRRRGIPCGSGAVESAVRRIVNLRLKSPGIFWSHEMAEDVLHLRAQLQCGQWDVTMKLILENDALWVWDYACKAARKAS